MTHANVLSAPCPAGEWASKIGKQLSAMTTEQAQAVWDRVGIALTEAVAAVLNASSRPSRDACEVLRRASQERDGPLTRDDDHPDLREALNDIADGLEGDYPARTRYGRLAWGIKALIDNPTLIRQLGREEGFFDACGAMPNHIDEVPTT